MLVEAPWEALVASPSWRPVAGASRLSVPGASAAPAPVEGVSWV